MSFSLAYIDLDEIIFLGEGPLRDVFASFTTETLLLYIGTWLIFITRSWWYYWVITIGLFYVGIRICMNLIAAFPRGSEAIGNVEYEYPADPEEPVYVGGVQVFGETAERIREASNE